MSWKRKWEFYSLMRTMMEISIYMRSVEAMKYHQITLWPRIGCLLTMARDSFSKQPRLFLQKQRTVPVFVREISIKMGTLTCSLVDEWYLAHIQQIPEVLF